MPYWAYVRQDDRGLLVDAVPSVDEACADVARHRFVLLTPSWNCCTGVVYAETRERLQARLDRRHQR